MKKIYVLSSILFSVTISTFAQDVQWAQKNADQPTKKNTIVADRAADDVIWQNNFDEPADWTPVFRTFFAQKE